MAGIYIHIPFCKQACNYCDFHFSTSLRHKDSLLEAIIKEIDIRKEKWKNIEFETIYFGGGTPSILNPGDIEKLLDKLYKEFNIHATEISLEGNPDDLKLEKLKAYKSFGINRLSVGVQSFHEADLKLLNRSHNAKQAVEALENISKAGFTNFNLDLIYGIPGLDDNKWVENIELALKFNAPHISAYALTVEDKTALKHLIKTGKLPAVSDTQSAEQFDILRKLLSGKGFEHYEISNFAKKGYHSRHNTLYWQNIPYLGLGPSAHSFKNNRRSWNIANNSLYMKKLSSGDFYDEELLSDKDIYNEKIMTGLRTSRGINLQNLSEFEKKFLLEKARMFIMKKQLEIEGQFLKSSPGMFFLIEGIIVELFME